ncbi:SF0329 family protein [Vibrio sp. WJH972]
MQWSKRKKKVEEFFCESVKGRVELRSTHYRGSQDEQGRGYITFDKTEIWSMCTLSFYSIEYERIEEIINQKGITPYEAQKITHEELASEGKFNQYTFYDSLDEYCNNSIEASMESDNLLIRCLAMLDSRLGKRRLRNFELSKESQKVVQFYRIRCECEGIPFNNSKNYAPS